MIKFIKRANFSFLCFVALSGAISAQTNGFTCQGKRTDSGAMLAIYDFEFRLCDSLAADCSASLAAQQLSPCQPITSEPYAIKSLKSFNSENLGSLAPNTYLQNAGDGSNLINVAKPDVSNVFTGSDNTFPQITLSGDGQIIAPRLENSAADPTTAAATNARRIYFNATDNAVKVSNGTAWVNLMPAARQIQTFSGQVAESSFRCDRPNVLRSVSFTKSSVASRLRITYRDKAKTGGSSNGFGMNVNVKIDGVSITPLITIFDAENSPFANSTTPFFSVSSPFTTVGYVSNTAAGTHTLTSEYIRVNTANAPVVCFVTNNPYFIEIEEIP